MHAHEALSRAVVIQLELLSVYAFIKLKSVECLPITVSRPPNRRPFRYDHPSQ
jgi:hypothetical protein